MASFKDFKKFMFGENAADIKLTPEQEALQQNRNKLFSNAYKNYMKGGPTEGELAVNAATNQNMQQALAGQTAMANSGRGFGAVAARYQAMNNAGQLQQNIAAQGAISAGQQRAQDRNNMLGYLTTQSNIQNQESLAEQQAKAKKGFFGTLLGTAGGIAGAYFGKSPEAAAAGAQLGYGVGEATSGAVRNY